MVWHSVGWFPVMALCGLMSISPYKWIRCASRLSDLHILETHFHKPALVLWATEKETGQNGHLNLYVGQLIKAAVLFHAFLSRTSPVSFIECRKPSMLVLQLFLFILFQTTLAESRLFFPPVFFYLSVISRELIVNFLWVHPCVNFFLWINEPKSL